MSPETSATSCLEDVAHHLTTHPQQLRIKKLVYSACRRTWENNPAVLNQQDLGQLLAQLVRDYPSPEQLQIIFGRIVATLNHQAEYNQVATVILSSVEPLYSFQQAATAVMADADDDHTATLTSSAPTAGVKPYEAIAQTLAQHPQQLRLKKLVYCLCHQRWENSPEVLDPISFETLLPYLHQITPSHDHLTYALSQLIKRLNRPDQYGQLAQTLVQRLSTLYQKPIEDHTTTLSRDEATYLAATEDEHTTFNPATQVSNEQTQAFNPSLHLAEEAAHAPVASANPPAVKDRKHLFELRLEITKYTSPLQAKILLFSTVQRPFQFTVQDWQHLRSFTLEDLLRDTFDYCTSFSDLETKLTIIASCLDSPDEGSQAASALLRAMKPYYAPNKLILVAP